MSSRDAVDREATWLQVSGDGLPALQVADGGAFDVVQAYDPRTPNTSQTTLYVTRARLKSSRFAQQQVMNAYALTLEAKWPIGATTIGAQIAENEQRAFDAAIDDVVARVRALVTDKTHGGRFIAVAESPARSEIDVRFDPADQTISQGFLRAVVTYEALDAPTTD